MKKQANDRQTKRCYEANSSTAIELNSISISISISRSEPTQKTERVRDKDREMVVSRIETCSNHQYLMLTAYETWHNTSIEHLPFYADYIVFLHKIRTHHTFNVDSKRFGSFSFYILLILTEACDGLKCAIYAIYMLSTFNGILNECNADFIGIRLSFDPIPSSSSSCISFDSSKVTDFTSCQMS